MEPSKQGPPPDYNQSAPNPQAQPYPAGQPGQPYPAGQPGQPYPTGQPGQPVGAYPGGGYQAGQPGYQQGQPTVVVAQPVATTAIVSSTPRPPDYMIPSILVCLFCFWPTGIAAIYFSSRANSMVAEGNMSEAQRFSRNARNLLIASIVAGVIWIVIVIAVRVAAAATYASTYRSY